MGWPFYGAHIQLASTESAASLLGSDLDGGSNEVAEQQRLLDEYIGVMVNASFASNTTVYVASDLLSDGPSPGAPTPLSLQ